MNITVRGNKKEKTNTKNSPLRLPRSKNLVFVQENHKMFYTNNLKNILKIGYVASKIEKSCFVAVFARMGLTWSFVVFLNR